MRILKVKYPAASYGASNLQRSRAAGYLTLAAFAKYPCNHGYLAHCFAGIKAAWRLSERSKRGEVCEKDY